MLSAVLILVLSLVATSAAVFARPTAVGVSPTLNVLLDFSVLGGEAVTNTGGTTTTGAVGVSPGTSLTGFSSTDGGPGVAGGGTHVNDQTAIDAQTEALTVYGALDQTCDQDWSGGGVVELGGRSLVPGVYCADAFALEGTLTLTGGAEEVYIFKSASTIITASGSSVEGGDPCNVWWRAVSNVTLGTSSSFIGNVFSAGESTSAMTTGATLGGRFIGLSPVTITLDTNTIFAPVCLEPLPTEEPTATATTTATTAATTAPTTEPTEEPTKKPTTAPETLPDTGGDFAGPGSQIIRFSLGALGITLILFGFVLSRNIRKAEK